MAARPFLLWEEEEEEVVEEKILNLEFGVEKGGLVPRKSGEQGTAGVLPPSAGVLEASWGRPVGTHPPRLDTGWWRSPPSARPSPTLARTPNTWRGNCDFWMSPV